MTIESTSRPAPEIPLQRHSQEMQANLAAWQRKPLLRVLYRQFHARIARQLPSPCHGQVVELGSGIPDIREEIPGCLRTDVIPNPWIDQLENAYRLSFESRSLSALVLFDVFHHLRYPGTALQEFHRVLLPGGRVIILEPCMSWLGRLVFGVFHHEPLALGEPIDWHSPPGWTADAVDYYAAQGNAFRIFLNREIDVEQSGWKVCRIERFSALPYILSGGYSRPQLYPNGLLPVLEAVGRLCDHLPRLFATRLLVVLEKTGDT